MGSSTRSAGAKLLLLTSLTAAGLVASATAATVYAASDNQRRHATRPGSTKVVSLDASRNVEAVLALADSLVEPLGALAPTDSATLAQIVALVSAPGDSALWIPHQPADTSNGQARAAYRRWTHSTPLPAFWGIRSGFPGLADSRMIPMSRMQPLKRLWKESEASADSALLAGDTETALLRSRETISGARHLIAQPRPVDALVGRVMMSDGAKLLARVALQADQPALHSSAQRLLILARTLQPTPQGLWDMKRGELHEARLLEMARDRTLHPATRFVAIELMVASACASTREVLFGPAPARHAALDVMINATRDIPHVDELRPLFHNTLARLDTAPEAFLRDIGLPRRTDEPLSETLLRLVVPGKVQARIDACRASGS